MGRTRTRQSGSVSQAPLTCLPENALCFPTSLDILSRRTSLLAGGLIVSEQPRFLMLSGSWGQGGQRLLLCRSPWPSGTSHGPLIDVGPGPLRGHARYTAEKSGTEEGKAETREQRTAVRGPRRSKGLPFVTFPSGKVLAGSGGRGKGARGQGDPSGSRARRRALTPNTPTAQSAAASCRG